MPDVKVNTRLLSQAFKEYEQATKKAIPEILNRAGRNIAFKAAQYTPKATKANIRASLTADPHLVYALTSMKLKQQSRGILPAPEFAEATRKFIARRQASIGFIRSGWATAIEKLGGVYKGMKTKTRHGYASKASLLRFVTTIANTVPGCDKIGAHAMQVAVNNVAVDMLNHARGILNKLGRKYSGG